MARILDQRILITPSVEDGREKRSHWKTDSCHVLNWNGFNSVGKYWPIDIMNEWLRGLNRPSSTVLVAGMLVLGAAGGGILYGEEISNWVGGDTEYELIDFDSNQTRAYAQGLVNLGDPVWGGRLSGTVEEENAAQSIKTNFKQRASFHSRVFEVPLYYMGNSFELMICNSGTLEGFSGDRPPV